jgi:hypothetical protein
MSERTPDVLLRVARHEASHAIAFTVLCAGVEFCDIQDNGPFDGWTKENPFAVRLLLPAAISFMAGFASQQVFGGQTRDVAIRNCGRDFNQMFDIAEAHLPEPERKKFYHDACIAAYSFVLKYRQQIETLAQELLTHGRVEGDRVREIVERGR